VTVGRRALALGSILWTTAAISAPAACPASDAGVHFRVALSHTAARLRAGLPVTIVAIGSSSTYGTGASGAEHSYPARLEADLAPRMPTVTLHVINKGVPGEEAPQMVGRFTRDVLAAHPTLVIWQLGTNLIIGDKPVGSLRTVIGAGVRRLRASGADVILMDPQYAPMVLARPRHDAVVADVAAAAQDSQAALFPRFRLMRRWVETDRVPLAEMIAPDGLHMDDRGYECLAATLAGAIVESLRSGPVSPPSSH
jgi:lysophospholipase L1-like esterase